MCKQYSCRTSWANNTIFHTSADFHVKWLAFIKYFYHIFTMSQYLLHMQLILLMSHALTHNSFGLLICYHMIQQDLFQVNYYSLIIALILSTHHCIPNSVHIFNLFIIHFLNLIFLYYQINRVFIFIDDLS